MTDAQTLSAALGRLMAAYRQSHKMTRKEMASAMDMSEKRIQQLESEVDESDVRFGMIVSFAQLQKKSVTQLVKELMTEAGSKESAENQGFLDHAAQKHLTKDSVIRLKKHTSKDSQIFGNELAWALELSSILLSLSDSDRLDLEMSIRRKSPQSHEPEQIARIKEIFNYTLDM